MSEPAFSMDVKDPITSLMFLADIEATRRLTPLEVRLKRGFFQLAVLQGFKFVRQQTTSSS
jgi:hypothetical protein